MTTALAQHEESERIILASMMHDHTSVTAARALVSGQDFVREPHQRLYAVLLELYDRHGLCDLGTLTDYQREREIMDFEEYGGWQYLVAFNNYWLGHGVPLDPYARIVKEASCRRRLQRVGQELIDRAASMQYGIDTLTDYAMQQIRDSLPPNVRHARTLYEIGIEERERIRKELHGGVSTGFKTGWHSLNNKLSPIRPGQVVMIGARPGMGKTAFAVNWALSLAESNLPGVIYSLEMEETELSLRAMLQYMTTTNTELDNPSELQHKAAEVLEEIDHALMQLPRGIRINDKSMTIGDISAELRDMCRQEQQTWAMVDFLQLARADRRYRSRQEEVGAMAYELAELAKELKISIIALSQLSREVDKESPRRPRKDHFLESGKIEAAAHRMLYLYRPSEYGPAEVQASGLREKSPDEFTEVGILKQRSGVSTGKTILFYDGEHYAFRSLNEKQVQFMKGERDEC